MKKKFFLSFLFLITVGFADNWGIIVGPTGEYGNVRAQENRGKGNTIAPGTTSSTTLSLSNPGIGFDLGGYYTYSSFYAGLLGKMSFMHRKGFNKIQGTFLGSSFYNKDFLTQKFKYGAELRLGHKGESVLIAVLGSFIQSKFEITQKYKLSAESFIHEQNDNKYPIGGEVGLVIGYDLPYHLQMEGLFSYIFYQNINTIEIHGTPDMVEYHLRESCFTLRFAYIF